MNTPPTKQAKQEYVNPFGAPNQMSNDPNVKLYPKLEVQDNLTRIVQGKDPRLKLNNPGDFEGSHSAYSAMNQQIAHSLLAKNSEQLKLLQVKPELQAVGAESPQKYAPHAQLSGQEYVEFRGPERFNNNDFLSQFHDLFYKGETDRIQIKQSNYNPPQSTGGSSTMNALQIAMLEDKIKEYVVNELKQLKSVMVANQSKALKNMSQKHANQTNRLVRGLSRRIKENDSLYKSNLGASAIYESSRIPSMTNSVYDGNQQQMNAGQNILATKLIEDIQEAVAAEILNCKPIEGSDIPLRQVKYGRGGELLLVQDLTQADCDNATEDINITREAFESHFSQNMYQYLVPSGFKKYKQSYIDEEDLFSIKAPVESKPKFESKEPKAPVKDSKPSNKELREKKEEELFKMDIKEVADPEDKTTAEERDRTLKLMVKLLSRHVEDAKEESKQLSSFFKETESKINNFKKELEQEETKTLLDDIRRRKDIADKEMEESLTSADNLKSIRDARLEDLMVENQVMLAQIELFEKKKGIIAEEESEDEDLSDIDIQQLAYSDEKPKKKKLQKKKLGAKTGSMKVSSVLRPKTAKSKTNKGRSKKPIDKKILENNWNPQTSTAYGVKFNGIEKPSPVKHKERKAINKTKNLREKSLEKFSQLNAVDKDKIQKVDKQLKDEVSRAFDEMAKILSKY